LPPHPPSPSHPPLTTLAAQDHLSRDAFDRACQLKIRWSYGPDGAMSRAELCDTLDQVFNESGLGPIKTKMVVSAMDVLGPDPLTFINNLIADRGLEAAHAQLVNDMWGWGQKSVALLFVYGLLKMDMIVVSLHQTPTLHPTNPPHLPLTHRRQVDTNVKKAVIALGWAPSTATATDIFKMIMAKTKSFAWKRAELGFLLLDAWRRQADILPRSQGGDLGGRW
jgi:hypothetical protein